MRYCAILLVAAAMLAGGCAKNMGYIVKPIPLNEELNETVVSSDPGWFVSDKIAVIDIDGLLMNARDTGLFSSGENPVSLFVEKIDKAQADPSVRALVLRINSPGGGVTASDIMYRRLQEFRQARKVPVVAVIEDVGASGAYYIACGADGIMAHPTSVTGSIGVIVQTLSFSGTLAKIGVDARAVTSGAYKDMGNPLKPLDPKDTALIQGIVDEFYGRFVSVVAKGRPKLTAADVKRLADGRVYTGQQAKDNGLVDSLGYVDDAIAAAKRSSGATCVKVVMYHRPTGQRENVYSQAPGLGTQVNLLNINAPALMSLGQSQFLYLWTGHN